MLKLLTTAGLLITLLCVAPHSAVLAQDAKPAVQQTQSGEQRRAVGDEGLRLPPRVTVTQTASIGGKKQDYQVTAGSIVLRNDAGEPQAEVGFIAYTIEGKPVSERPVTFAFNGGPGAASAYLNFGAIGPKRISFGNNGEGPSTSAVLIDNPETWLDFTDLVFIDPVGTGYSRFVSDNRDLKRSVWSVDGDISTLAAVVRRYLVEFNRMSSPKFLVGESYGGFRVPKLAYRLQTNEGVGVSGIIMISPVLDFISQSDSDGSPLSFAARLPSLTALALEKQGKPVNRETLAEVEGYARSDFVVDLLRGPRDKEAVARIIDRVTAFTGLDRTFVERQAGRLDLDSLARELGRDREAVASLYDATVMGADPVPFVLSFTPKDPILHASIAPLTSVAVDFLNRIVGWRVDAPYQLLSQDVFSNWNWGGKGNEAHEAVDDLREALALDPKLGALVIHGVSDLVTPYFDSQLVLDRLTSLGGDPEKGRVQLEVLRGGHMFYSHDSSRAALKEAARKLYPSN